MANNNTFNVDPWRLLGWMMDITVVGIIGFLVFLNTQINDLQTWRASIQSTTYTQSDHNQYAVSIANEFRNVEKEMSAIRNEQLKESKIVSTQLAALHVQLENIQLMLRGFEIKLEKITDKQ